MLRNLIAFAALAAILLGLESYRSNHLQSHRNAEQAQLLLRMEALNNRAASQLVADWRLVYPEPNDDRLAELRDLVSQVEADPEQALGQAAAQFKAVKGNIGDK